MILLVGHKNAKHAALAILVLITLSVNGSKVGTDMV
ncbi:hypothetical protein PSECIP111854_03918 [Pseudoalteromonas sp. CIP111854]|uniref:Uncharacterized protein n=1 Tax=Pseudoalteromonas holothuriae TaxID=2963714 RepID=A0A9W4R4K4_9GAMM|nr:hypothetical protein PSECIP111854_03918 [Pseudoalteromonas sp. CIP111854]